MIVFFKRYRMQFDLRGVDFGPLLPPENFSLVPWRSSLLSAHAKAKFLSFRDEMDANVFSCFGNEGGCQRLMRDISRQSGFVPESTWLLTFLDPQTGASEVVGTVQGISNTQTIGLIQNIGVVKKFRGKGLGSLIVRRSLQGFQSYGARLVTLEVTAKNTGAIRLYERLGFQIQKTVYKSVNVAGD